MDQLRFSFEREDDWHGKLIAKVTAQAFAGEGGAWFNTDELRDFARALSVYPLQEDALPSISGGFGATDGAPGQVHLAVSFEPYNARGAVMSTVQLATEVWNGAREDLASTVTVRFLVTYGDLARFGPDLLDLLEGRRAEATLDSSAQ